MLIVIGCGAKKRGTPSPARDLYIGAQFSMTLRAAEVLQASCGGRILILSGLHGFVGLDQVISPYEQKMGEPGCVGSDLLQAQTGSLGINQEAEVIILAGRNYVEAAKSVWPHLKAPLLSLGGIGYQRQVLSRIIRGEKIIDWP